LILEKQQGEQDKMLNCITEEIGFVDSKPVAATIIFRALLHWRSFEAERTNIFDRIIQVTLV
jgi:myosin-5